MITLLLLLLFVSSAEGYPLTSIPVQWDTTVSTESTSRNLDSPYIGECVCDVTWGACDPFCCCDPDCTKETVATFEYCLPQQYGFPHIDYCYPSNSGASLKRINNIDSKYIDRVTTGYSAICVIRTNHPSDLYRYFKVPQNVTQPVVSSETEIYIGVNESYSVGDSLPTAKYTDTVDGVAYRRAGWFQIPTMEANGACSPIGQNIGYLIPTQGVSCTLNGSQICTLFPVSTYTNLFVQSVRGLNISSLSLVPVEVQILNVSSNTIGTLDPTVVPPNSSLLSYTNGDICYNAIIHSRAEFTYDSNVTGKITKAVLNLTVSNIYLERFTSLLFESNFVQENKVFPRNIFSGTPSYLPGQRLRAGTLVTSEEREAILEIESGFALPSGGRSCSLQQFRRINFMYSVLSNGCFSTVNETALQTLCSTGTGSLISSVLQSSTGSSDILIDRVAVTNDALTNDTSGWISIEGLSETLTSVPGTYDAFYRRCSNVTVGIHYQFVIAYAGAEYNAQNVIVGAFATPIMGSFQINNSSNYTAAATSALPLQFRVSFSQYKEGKQEMLSRKVVAPSILPRLDDTVFYPFRSP